MKLLIDASNAIAGGGVTHLVELLRHARPRQHGFGEVEVWGPRSLLGRLEGRPWLTPRPHRLLEGGYLARWRWKRGTFRRAMASADLVYVPATGWHPDAPGLVTMCRNLLPLEWEEINRYPFGKAWLRAAALRFLHRRAYRRADGLICLNDYSLRRVEEQTGRDTSGDAVIPHGLNPRFLQEREDYRADSPFRLLCVASIDAYKHQWVMAEAVARLHADDRPMRLRLIGPAYNGCEKKLEEVRRRHPVLEEIMEWEGEAGYEELPEAYRRADAFLYGSTCETFGMTLLEAMGSGLPIACSERSSMEEMLGKAGIYYDPLSVDSCMDAILRLYTNSGLRETLGREARDRARDYDWVRCARDTFEYLQSKAKE